MDMFAESPTSGVNVKKVPHKDFARRLELACDGNPQIPPLNYGRNTWLRDRCEEHGLKISTEGIRKWFAGESRPKRNAVNVIAQILQVDVQWLETGAQPELDVRQRRQFKATGNGAVNIVAGFVQMDGGTVAFPDDDDTEAMENLVSFYAIIRGAKYSFHVVAPIEAEKGRFIVPLEAHETIVLGLQPVGQFAFQVYEFDWETMDAVGKKNPNGIEITLEDHPWHQVETFSQRI